MPSPQSSSPCQRWRPAGDQNPKETRPVRWRLTLKSPQLKPELKETEARPISPAPAWLSPATTEPPPASPALWSWSRFPTTSSDSALSHPERSHHPRRRKTNLKILFLYLLLCNKLFLNYGRVFQGEQKRIVDHEKKLVKFYVS